jgi:hypothetical protein
MYGGTGRGRGTNRREDLLRWGLDPVSHERFGIRPPMKRGQRALICPSMEANSKFSRQNFAFIPACHAFKHFEGEAAAKRTNQEDGTHLVSVIVDAA